MITLAKRNIMIFLRDRAGIFWSFLSVLLVFGLYVLFLGNLMGAGEDENSRFLTDSWIMAGMVSIASITTTMGAFVNMVVDKSDKILKDFSASPITRRSLVGGYILGAYAIGIIMTIITFIFTQFYIVLNGGQFLPLLDSLEAIGIMFISVLASSAMVFYLTTFLKTENAFSGASAVLGVLVGFITGTYIPIGTFPDVIQTVIKIFPISHSASLLRQIMMRTPIDLVFANAPDFAITEFSKEMGIVFYFGETSVSPITSILVLAATTVLFYTLAIINVSRKKI